MKKPASLPIICLLVVLPAVLSAQVDTVWHRTYGNSGPEDDEASCIACDDSGDVYVAGASATGLPIIRYDRNGNLDRTISYPGEVVGIAVDRRRNIYVTGCYGDSFLTRKHDSLGTLLWSATYAGPGSSSRPSTIALDESANAYVCGYRQDSSNTGGFVTLKYDSTGNLRWCRTYYDPSHGNDGATSIAIDSRSRVYVTGSVEETGGQIDLATLGYDSTGETLWANIYYDAYPICGVQTDPEGNVSVAATSGGHAILVKYDGLGHQLGVARSPLPFNAYAMALDGAGGCYVVGRCYISPGNYDFAIGRVIRQMVFEWVQQYDTGCANAVAVDLHGDAYVTGQLAQDGYFWTLTVKYDTAGNELWACRTGGDGAIALALDSIGGFATVGNIWTYQEHGVLFYDYLTIKYWQQSGVQERNTPVSHGPSGLTADPDPMRSRTTIRYSTPSEAEVSLQVFNPGGRLVRTLVSAHQPPGEHSVVWTGTDGKGRRLPSGLYFCRIRAGPQVDTRKLLLVD